MNWVNIGSDNGLSRPRHQAIVWTNAGMLEYCLLDIEEPNFREIPIDIRTLSFKEMH